MRRTDPVPHRQGWTFGLWQRDRGWYHVAVYHEASRTGLRARGRTREAVITDAHRQIDALYLDRLRTVGTAAVEETVTIIS